MKYLTSMLVALLLSSVCTAQADSSKPRTDSLLSYAVILNEQEIGSLIALIRTADEKPSIINAWISLISNRARQLQPPPKEQPKK